MGQMDIGQKVLEAHNDVFADIVNVLLFDGEEVLKEGELEDQAPRSAYKADGKYREIERDVAKRWKNGDVRIACLGIENQTNTDSDMPLRVLAYDGSEYRAQLNPDNRSESRYPVITLVLYFDYKRKWNKPLSLLDCMNIPEKIKPYVNDYRVNLFDIAYLSKEQVDQFKSDFRFVADYFVQMRTTGEYKGSNDEIKYVQDTLSMMSIMTRDTRFEDILSDKSTLEGKEIRTMCEFLDKVEAKGEQRGEMRRAVEDALRMINGNKLSLEDIAEYTCLPLSKIQELANERTA